MRKTFNIKPVKINTKELYSYSIPLIFMITSLTCFYSIDVWLVKHYFTAEEAGLYSAVSLIGKIIFFCSLSISQVMFPKASELHESGKSSKSLLYKSVGIILLFIIPMLALYFIFPNFIINVLYGADYLYIAPLVGWFGLFIALTSLVYLISFYKVSVNHKLFIIILWVFNILQIVGIVLFHNSLAEVVKVLIITMFLLFVILALNVLISKDGKTINNNTSVQ